MCLPGLVLLIVIISMVGPGMWTVIISLGILWGIVNSRVIRSTVVSIKENVYVKASRAIGCSTPRIFLRHILPNIAATIMVQFSIWVPQIILMEASLSFLGYGIPPPVPSWGGMLGGMGRSYMFLAPWMVLWPGLALSVVVYGVNMFGDALRDLLDPRLKGGAGRFGVQVRRAESEEATRDNSTVTGTLVGGR
jgi:peptide/nickel transport system permease protein